MVMNQYIFTILFIIGMVIYTFSYILKSNQDKTLMTLSSIIYFIALAVGSLTLRYSIYYVDEVQKDVVVHASSMPEASVVLAVFFLFLSLQQVVRFIFFNMNEMTERMDAGNGGLKFGK